MPGFHKKAAKMLKKWETSTTLDIIDNAFVLHIYL